MWKYIKFDLLRRIPEIRARIFTSLSVINRGKYSNRSKLDPPIFLVFVLLCGDVYVCWRAFYVVCIVTTIRNCNVIKFVQIYRICAETICHPPPKFCVPEKSKWYNNQNDSFLVMNPWVLFHRFNIIFLVAFFFLLHTFHQRVRVGSLETDTIESKKWFFLIFFFKSPCRNVFLRNKEFIHTHISFCKHK